jgi:hypothetical protein
VVAVKILLMHRGNLTPIVAARPNQPIPEALTTRGTSHAGEVNALLVSHWLREDHGHEVHWYSEREPGQHDWLLPPVGPSVDVDDYDMVLMWTIVGVKLAARSGVLEKLTGQKLATWYDAGGLENLLGIRQRSKVSHIVWGTRGLLEAEMYKWPDAHHAVAEHACNFLTEPTPIPLLDRGVYFGRLPRPYLDAVRQASASTPMDVFGLWALDANGYKTSLRPGCTDLDVDNARAAVETESIRLFPAINIGAEHATLSCYSFGLCPSTRATPRQLLSASKFWDIAGLGLPVLLSSNTPEARLFRETDVWLGELYDPGDLSSMSSAIRRIQERAGDDLIGRRTAIRDWIAANHTYRHRAKEISDAVS